MTGATTEAEASQAKLRRPRGFRGHGRHPGSTGLRPTKRGAVILALCLRRDGSITRAAYAAGVGLSALRRQIYTDVPPTRRVREALIRYGVPDRLFRLGA